MIATDDNLEEFAKLARAEQARGVRTITFRVEAQLGYCRFINLWEDAIGEVVGRVFEKPEEPINPAFPKPRNVKYFTVRADIAAIIAAWRRRQERELRQFGRVT
jgi:hypothetical protein